MKKRRNLIVALLLVVATVVGIGYAKLVDDLYVGTTANYSIEVANQEFDEDIKFVKAESNGYCSAGISVSDATGDTVYIHIGGEDGGAELSTPQQSAVATFTIENRYESAVKILLNVIEDNNVDKKYDISVDVSQAQNIPGLDPATDEGGTAKVTVTITPKYNFTEAFTGYGFTIKLNAELAG